MLIIIDSPVVGLVFVESFMLLSIVMRFMRFAVVRIASVMDGESTGIVE